MKKTYFLLIPFFFLTKLFATDFQLSDLPGEWAGKSLSDAQITYTFQKSGSVVWQSDDSNFKKNYPVGIGGTWSLTPGNPVWNFEIKDFNIASLGGVTFQGILQPLSQHQFKMEGRLSSEGGRPASFSAQAVTYSKVVPLSSAISGTASSTNSINPNPKSRATRSVVKANGESPIPGAAVRHTISTYPYSRPDVTILAIQKDNSLIMCEPNFAPIVVPNFNNVVNLAPDTHFAETADGMWWFFGSTTKKLPLDPQTQITSVAQGAGQVLGLLTSDGTAYIAFGDLTLGPKPSSLLDKIVSISAQDIFNSTSHRYTMLRSDGTVWSRSTLDNPDALGWVTKQGGGTTSIKGLEHIKDISTYSLDLFDTGIAVRDDGSVVYWGAQDPPSHKTAPDNNGMYKVTTDVPPLDEPSLKPLAHEGKVLKIAAGPEVCGFIDTQGKVWVFGGGGYFRLPAPGAGASTGSTAPVMIEGITDAVDLELTEGHAVALCRDGTVWSWSAEKPPVKVFENIQLPNDPIVPSENYGANPILGEWLFQSDVSAPQDLQFTETDMISTNGSHVQVRYKIEQNTVTVMLPDPTPPYVCTLKTTNYGEVIIGSENPFGPRVVMTRKTAETPAPAAPTKPDPDLLTLAHLSQNIYSGNTGYGDYTFVGNNCTFPPNTCDNAGFAAGAYAKADGSKVVIAIRGTIFFNGIHEVANDIRGTVLFDGLHDILNAEKKTEIYQTVAADLTYPFGGGPFTTDLRDATEFVQEVQKRYHNATITLTGHSLGGLLAQMLSKASGLSAYTFNAPGGNGAYGGAQKTMVGFALRQDANYININYRVVGDPVSLIGVQLGKMETMQYVEPTEWAHNMTMVMAEITAMPQFRQNTK